MKNSYRITPRAAQDLRNIGRYTLETWGRDQRNSYLLTLEKRFEWLADNPGSGRHRPEIKEGYFSYLQGAHVIFYLQRKGGIDIIGIPHQRMDIETFFM